MTSDLNKLYLELTTSMGVEDLHIPITAVKFFEQVEDIPDPVIENHPIDITLTCCQALKQALLGDPVCLTLENIGCVAAAISLGLVAETQTTPINDSTVYTDVMRDQSNLNHDFVPPSPKDFTDGTVYACKAMNRFEFCLFGQEDSGRYKDQETAKRAIKDMTAIQPATMRAVFLYPPEFEEVELIPDIVVLSVRPVELTRIIQAYQYNTGKRVIGSMGAVRVVCSDLMARPYLNEEMNVSSFCLGARLIARFEANRIGIGMPFNIFGQVVKGMKESKTGYPFHLYPGVTDGL